MKVSAPTIGTTLGWLLPCMTLETRLASAMVKGGAEQVTHDNMSDPSLSPDGRQMVVVALVDGKEQLAIVRTDGSTPVRITRAPLIMRIRPGRRMAATLHMCPKKAGARRSTSSIFMGGTTGLLRSQAGEPFTRVGRLTARCSPIALTMTFDRRRRTPARFTLMSGIERS